MDSSPGQMLSPSDTTKQCSKTGCRATNRKNQKDSRARVSSKPNKSTSTRPTKRRRESFGSAESRLATRRRTDHPDAGIDARADASEEEFDGDMCGEEDDEDDITEAFSDAESFYEALRAEFSGGKAINFHGSYTIPYDLTVSPRQRVQPAERSSESPNSSAPVSIITSASEVLSSATNGHARSFTMSVISTAPPAAVAPSIAAASLSVTIPTSASTDPIVSAAQPPAASAQVPASFGEPIGPTTHAECVEKLAAQDAKVKRSASGKTPKTAAAKPARIVHLRATASTTIRNLCLKSYIQKNGKVTKEVFDFYFKGLSPEELKVLLATQDDGCCIVNMHGRCCDDADRDSSASTTQVRTNGEGEGIGGEKWVLWVVKLHMVKISQWKICLNQQISWARKAPGRGAGGGDGGPGYYISTIQLDVARYSIMYTSTDLDQARLASIVIELAGIVTGRVTRRTDGTRLSGSPGIPVDGRLNPFCA
ncbi:hypothetical protein B0H10DRAFT_1960522 [Mycena sp. CBHHK59/15]|nr:hypothetical protein B0H10DRAFT_1960522 [Mycena sp. CBHHK59/15]